MRSTSLTITTKNNIANGTIFLLQVINRDYLFDLYLSKNMIYDVKQRVEFSFVVSYYYYLDTNTRNIHTTQTRTHTDRHSYIHTHTKYYTKATIKTIS